MLLASLIAAGLSGCAIVHLDGDPRGTPPLKQTADAAAETAVGFATQGSSATRGGSVQDAWRDGGGSWHWTQVDQSGATLQCEGPKVGMPTLCD